MGEIAFKKIIIALLTLIFLVMSANYIYQRMRDAREVAEMKEFIGEWQPSTPGKSY